MFHYIFYRLARHQMRMIRDSYEAILSAICFMCFPPLAFFGFFDLLISWLTGQPALSSVIGKKLYVLVYICLFLIHYILLVQGGKYHRIIKKFDGEQSYGLAGTALVTVYFIAPILMTMGLIIAERAS